MACPSLPVVVRSRSSPRIVPRALLLAGCLLLPALGLSAQESIPQDLQQTLAARKALASDDQLAPLQIGVRVENRVAVLWGSVPSTEHAQRALSALKKLAQFQEVRDEMTVDSLLAAKSLPAPQVVWEAAPQSKPRPDQRPDQLTRFEAKRISDVPDWAKTPPRKLPDPATVLPPIAVPGPAAPPSALQQKLTALQRDDLRCKRLRLEVKDGLVTVSGAVARWEDLNEVSRLIANLPGVERVVLHTVRADGQR